MQFRDPQYIGNVPWPGEGDGQVLLQVKVLGLWWLAIRVLRVKGSLKKATGCIPGSRYHRIRPMNFCYSLVDPWICTPLHRYHMLEVELAFAILPFALS